MSAKGINSRIRNLSTMAGTCCLNRTNQRYTFTILRLGHAGTSCPKSQRMRLLITRRHPETLPSIKQQTIKSFSETSQRDIT
jgi:hypothetical protein